MVSWWLSDGWLLTNGQTAIIETSFGAQIVEEMVD